MNPLAYAKWIGLGAIAALFLTLGGYSYYAHDKIVKQAVIIAQYKTTVKTLGDANKTQSAAITVLGTRLDKAAGLRQQIELARDAALATQATIRADLIKSQASVKSLRGKLYASDTAARSWAFSPVPGALAGQLCDEWTSAGGDGGKGCGRAPSSVRPDSAGAARDADAGPAASASVLPVDCSGGCFSNDQLLGALDSALTWGLQCRSSLQAIAELERTAIQASDAAKPE